MPNSAYRFTYPFCYVPHPSIALEARNLIERIKSDPELEGLFREGKMLGILMVENTDGSISFLHAFSGNVGGRNSIEGFVPPIIDLLDPNGYFKTKEREITAINHRIAESSTPSEELDTLKALRKSMSNDLQDWIFRNAIVMNAKGESKSILEVFADRGMVPPGGTGDCAAPKLLNEAYRKGLKPVAMGEFWYGTSPTKEVRKEGMFYPSCMGKCGPLLAFMMQGLDVESNPLDRECDQAHKILYEDADIIVVNKPSGMLAVPGKTLKTSLQERLSKECGQTVHSCHRLDMDTSGVMVYAKSLEAKANVEQQFERREVHKTYIARLLPGHEIAVKGRIEIPLMLDYYDRPRQMADFESGKKAITEYEIIKIHDNGETDVRFTPLTGRTHQLRVHAAHKLGLERPIKGDKLYGDSSSERLHLHAESIRFTHPRNGEILEFMCEPDF